jgi:hypothetical protein
MKGTVYTPMSYGNDGNFAEIVADCEGELMFSIDLLAD